jgi:hypothetical protein
VEPNCRRVERPGGRGAKLTNWTDGQTSKGSDLCHLEFGSALTHRQVFRVGGLPISRIVSFCPSSRALCLYPGSPACAYPEESDVVSLCPSSRTRRRYPGSSHRARLRCIDFIFDGRDTAVSPLMSMTAALRAVSITRLCIRLSRHDCPTKTDVSLDITLGTPPPHPPYLSQSSRQQ